MLTEEKITLLAKVARSHTLGEPSTATESSVSILSLAAASYGAAPVEENTVPTGFDPAAAALFEAIVEGAYLVASADGVFDEDERRTFERVVATACGGVVSPKHIAALVSDLADQLSEDGLDARLSMLGRTITKREHALEVLRIAALIARASEDVSAVERSVLDKIAAACGLDAGSVDTALREVDEAMKQASV
jgi:tellurite resistance protein